VREFPPPAVAGFGYRFEVGVGAGREVLRLALGAEREDDLARVVERLRGGRAGERIGDVGLGEQDLRVAQVADRAGLLCEQVDRFALAGERRSSDRPIGVALEALVVADRIGVLLLGDEGLAFADDRFRDHRLELGLRAAVLLARRNEARASASLFCAS
jgi:hypothetical protein